MLIASATPSGVGASTATPECECNVTRNDFAVSIPGQGVLTESIACTPNSPLYYCTASGNIVWTPSVNCCGAATDWGTSASATADSCVNLQGLACSGPTSNLHSCVAACTLQGSAISFIGGIYDCTTPTPNPLGSARKDFLCKNL